MEDYRTGAAQDAETHHGRAAGLLHLLTSGRAVGRLPHGERAEHADAGGHRGRAAGLPDGPGPGRVHHQPNHLALDRSAADQDTATASSIAAALLRRTRTTCLQLVMDEPPDRMEFYKRVEPTELPMDERLVLGDASTPRMRFRLFEWSGGCLHCPVVGHPEQPGEVRVGGHPLGDKGGDLEG